MTDLLSRIPTAHSVLFCCKHNLNQFELNSKVSMLSKTVHFELLNIGILEWNYKSFLYSENVANVVLNVWVLDLISLLIVKLKAYQSFRMDHPPLTSVFLSNINILDYSPEWH